MSDVLNVQSGPPAPKRTRWQKIVTEVRLLRRDGLRQYVRSVLALRRFERSVRRLP